MSGTVVGVPPTRWSAGAPPRRSSFLFIFFKKNLHRNDRLPFFYSILNSVFANNQQTTLDLQIYQTTKYLKKGNESHTSVQIGDSYKFDGKTSRPCCLLCFEFVPVFFDCCLRKLGMAWIYQFRTVCLQKVLLSFQSASYVFIFVQLDLDDVWWIGCL